MEEIICPQCGRPNLIEAKKCWYCQTTLEKAQTEVSADPSVESVEIHKTSEHSDNKIKKPEEEENIPEWLQRIRALKEADNPLDEENPDWKQQDLFPDKDKKQVGKKKAQKTVSAKKSKQHATRSKKISEQSSDKEQPAIISSTKKEKKKPAADSDEMIDSLSDELPEGFTKL